MAQRIRYRKNFFLSFLFLSLLNSTQSEDILDQMTRGVWWQDTGDVTVSVGSSVTCVIQAPEEKKYSLSGPIICLGNPNRRRTGLLDPPKGNFVQVSCGEKHCCAIREDAEVLCWGNERAYRKGLPTGVTMIQVSVGDSVSCGVTSNGEILCWGPMSYEYGKGRGMTKPPNGHFVQVTMCGQHACALSGRGRLWCWGNAYHCKFGSCSHDMPEEYHDVQFQSVSCSSTLTCGLTAKDNKIKCWGSSHHRETDNIPDSPFVMINVFDRGICGILKGDGHVRRDRRRGRNGTVERPHGTVECWGDRSSIDMPPMEAEAALDISTSTRRNCATLPGQKLLCWGRFHTEVREKLNELKVLSWSKAPIH